MADPLQAIFNRLDQLGDGLLGFTENLGQLALNTGDAVMGMFGRESKDNSMMASTGSDTKADDHIAPGAVSKNAAAEEKVIDFRVAMERDPKLAQDVAEVRDNPIRLKEQDMGPTTAALAYNPPGVQSTPTGKGGPSQGAAPAGAGGAMFG